MANRFLTIDEVTAEAMSICPGATSEEELYARQWAYEALRLIGPNSDNIQVVTLYPEEFRLRKPDDFYKAIDIGLFDSSNNEVLAVYRHGNSRIHESYDSFFKSGVYAPSIGSYVEVSESANFFNLSSNSTNVSYGLLRYFSLPVDSEGQPLFPEYVRNAVKLFIRYQWSLRMDDRNFRSHEISWEKARNIAQGKNRINGPLYKKLAKEWVTMIPNFNTPNLF